MPRTDSRPDPSSTVRDQATHWFARERLGALDADERQARDAWLAADPEHLRQYQSMQALWRVADGLPDDEMRGILAQTDGMPAYRVAADSPWG